LAPGELSASEGLSILIKNKANVENVTFSSDGNGSMPIFDEKGRLIKVGICSVASLYEEVKKCIKTYNIEIEDALKVITSNVAKVLKLKNKGSIEIGKDADLVFDVRFLPNPYYVEDLRPMTGEDEAVYNYVMKWKETETFFEKLMDLLIFMIPGYKKEGKSQLVIAIGCTGGQHRSVALAKRIGEELNDIFDYNVYVHHRDAHIESDVKK
ncbi:MAG: RNase adapter RapZ, partial [Staphylococcus sp.]|nr:RNase adapter RapZ [Staphylococcus sp.]